MTSPPETDREYAYFRASGLFDPDDITDAIGLEASESWSVEEEFTRSGRKFKRRSSTWKLDSGLNDTAPLDKHVGALLDKLAPRRAGLLKAATLAKLKIVCVGYYYQAFSWELKFEHQQLATALNVGFWFDTYSFGDHHEQMVELREQLGVREKLETD